MTNAEVEELISSFQDKTMRCEDTGCLLWTAGRIDGGYGRFWMLRRKHLAHRVSYVLFRGDIPEGHVVDHLCGNKSCVEPSHLEPVTQEENVRRYHAMQTHCKRGHLLAGDNVKKQGKHGRVCRECRKIRGD